MSLREPIWWRLSRMTTVGSSVSVSSELHCSARLDRYWRRSWGGKHQQVYIWIQYSKGKRFQEEVWYIIVYRQAAIWSETQSTPFLFILNSSLNVINAAWIQIKARFNIKITGWYFIMVDNLHESLLAANLWHVMLKNVYAHSCSAFFTPFGQTTTG